MKEEDCVEWKPPHRRQNPNSYRIIDHETRMTLIQMVFQRRFSIYRAAKVLGLNHSTCKAIIRKYRQTGHIFKRKEQQSLFQSQKPLQLLSTERQKIQLNETDNNIQTTSIQTSQLNELDFTSSNILYYQFVPLYDHNNFLPTLNYWCCYGDS